MVEITLNDVLQAAERIQVHRTPVMTSDSINEFASKNRPVELFFKCELLQKTGCKFLRDRLSQTKNDPVVFSI